MDGGNCLALSTAVILLKVWHDAECEKSVGTSSLSFLLHVCLRIKL